MVPSCRQAVACRVQRNTDGSTSNLNGITFWSQNAEEREQIGCYILPYILPFCGGQTAVQW